MITVRQFLAKVSEIDDEHPTYRSGGDGSDGTCDCIGLIIGSIRRAGGKWTGTHGSNYAARNEIGNFRPVSKASSLNVGDIVFKAYNPGESGYNLPAAYKDHYDQRDYYHAGVVASVVPLMIIHCTSPDTETTVDGKKVKTSIRRDSTMGKWSYAAELIKVSYDGGAQNDAGGDDDMEALYQAVVATQSDPLRVREAPETGKIIGHVPKGRTVDVLKAGSWPRIRYNELVGYASGEYLRKAEQGAGGADQNAVKPDQNVADADQNEKPVHIPLSLAKQLYAALGEAMSID